MRQGKGSTDKMRNEKTDVHVSVCYFSTVTFTTYILFYTLFACLVLQHKSDLPVKKKMKWTRSQMFDKEKVTQDKSE